MVLALTNTFVLATNMNELKNLKYIIPQPLKGVIRCVGSCIYDSLFCRYSRIDIATAIAASAAQNRSFYRIANRPDSDTGTKMGQRMRNVSSRWAWDRYSDMAIGSTHIPYYFDADKDAVWGYAILRKRINL